MKKTKFLFLVLILFISVFQAECKNKENPNLHCIDSLYDVNLNGCQQKILVQANNVANPILLYLHGGPGSSTLMWSHVYEKKLKENFVYVNWDQRGTAFSYHEGMDSSKISEDQIADDALELVKYLLAKFHQKKVYLIGHSFGSVIGLQLVANHPELFHAYIGVGQVIDFNKSKAITYKWLHKILEQANDTDGLKRIEANKFPYIDLVSKYGGHHRLTIDIDSIKRTSPYYYKGYLDLAKRGKEFSQYYVGKNPNPKAVLNKSLSEIKVPLYFFEGVNDHVIACAPELVVSYCKTVNAPHKEIIWFNNSAHIISVEEPEKFQDELIRIKTETEKKQDKFRVIAFCLGEGGNIEKYEIDKLTHLIFCFTNLQGNKISFKNSEDENRLKRFIALKAKYPKLKVLVSFGGWGGCETCSDVFASDSGRKEFVISVNDLLKKYHADGIDIDWESPVFGGYENHKASKDDKENFTSLIKELRNTLPAKSEICFDANSFKTYIDLSIDWQKIIPLVDYVNLMTYSLPCNVKGQTGHHAALYSSPFQNESAAIGIHKLDSLGVPMNKIIIGAGFYSEVSENVDSVNNGLGRPGTFKKNVNYNKLFETFKENEGYEYHWDSIAQAPFLYNKRLKTFVTFDDKKSVSLKTKYAIENKLGGIMFWNLKYDTYKDGLLDAIDKQIKTNK